MRWADIRSSDRIGVIALAVLSGLLVMMLLFPGSGVDTQPPVCWSMLFYEVPCNRWIAPISAVATAALVGLGAWMIVRHSR